MGFRTDVFDCALDLSKLNSFCDGTCGVAVSKLWSSNSDALT